MPCRITTSTVRQWTQGIAFSREGRTMLVQDMVGRRRRVFGWDGAGIVAQGDLAMGAGAGAIGTAWK